MIKEVSGETLSVIVLRITGLYNFYQINNDAT
jgi:hypothetical protein